MSLKSSLAVCWPIDPARSPKKSVNACATFSVTVASLSVSGNRPDSSSSGPFGEPEAWHSAATMRWMASRAVWRVDSL